MPSAVDWHESIADSFAAGYQRSPRFRERLTVWRGLIAAYIHPGDRVLDAGCGAGTFTFEAVARGATVDGIDGSPAMIGLARKRQAELGLEKASFQAALLETISTWPPEQYDAVMCSSVLEYLPDLHTEVARLVRMLRPGGRLILSMPNADSLYRKVEKLVFALTGRPRYFAHVRRMASEAELRELSASQGLQVRETRFYSAPHMDKLFSFFGGARRSKTLVVLVASRP